MGAPSTIYRDGNCLCYKHLGMMGEMHWCRRPWASAHWPIISSLTTLSTNLHCAQHILVQIKRIRLQRARACAVHVVHLPGFSVHCRLLPFNCFAIPNSIEKNRYKSYPLSHSDSGVQPGWWVSRCVQLHTRKSPCSPNHIPKQIQRGWSTSISNL